MLPQNVIISITCNLKTPGLVSRCRLICCGALVTVTWNGRFPRFIPSSKQEETRISKLDHRPLLHKNWSILALIVWFQLARSLTYAS